MLAVMEESRNKKHVEGGDREILYSKAIKAGKRIYYLDVKRNLKDDLFVAVTESKKIQSKDGLQISFEKHKIFLYKEDFEKFMEGMQDVIRRNPQKTWWNLKRRKRFMAIPQRRIWLPVI